MKTHDIDSLWDNLIDEYFFVSRYGEPRSGVIARCCRGSGSLLVFTGLLTALFVVMFRNGVVLC